MSETQYTNGEPISADREEIQSILEWQQQQYHHLQSLSFTLAGAIIAVLALLVTAIAGTDAFIFPTETAYSWEAAVSRGGFSKLGASLIYSCGGLAILVGFTFLIVAARSIVKKLFRLTFGPRLYPRLSNHEVVKVGERGESNHQRFTEKALEGINRNREILRRSKYEFKAVAIRTIAWFALLYFVYEMYVNFFLGRPGNLFQLSFWVVFPVAGVFAWLEKSLTETQSHNDEEEMLGMTLNDVENEVDADELVGLERPLGRALVYLTVGMAVIGVLDKILTAVLGLV